jgi:hypothetical protein
MSGSTDSQVLEAIARATCAPLDVVTIRYQNVFDALSTQARIPTYVPLLAARTVRHELRLQFG